MLNVKKLLAHSHTISNTKETYNYTYLQTSSNRDLQKFYQKALKFAEDDPVVMYVGNYKTDISKVLTENYVLVVSKSVYLYHKKEHCQVTMVKERLSQDTFVIYLQKNSPYTSLFDDV